MGKCTERQKRRGNKQRENKMTEVNCRIGDPKVMTNTKAVADL